MSISLIAFWLYVLVIGVLMIRLALAGKAFIDAWRREPTLFRRLFNRLSWTRTALFVLDCTLSFALAGLVAYIVPGVAGGPIGAVAGIMITATLQAAMIYGKRGAPT